LLDEGSLSSKVDTDLTGFFREKEFKFSIEGVVKGLMSSFFWLSTKCKVDLLLKFCAVVNGI
jgi:hypothetical protein